MTSSPPPNTTPDRQTPHSAAKAAFEPRQSAALMRDLPPAARRALAEAEARRQARDPERPASEREIGGRGGEDPSRYGDWEINGRAIDF